jgi:hypothetical protein
VGAVVPATQGEGDRSAAAGLLHHACLGLSARRRAYRGSLRSDYYHQFQDDQQLFERALRIDVLALATADAILPVIGQPAERLKVGFDPATTARDIANEAARARGGLPILSYVLEDAWRLMQGRQDGVFRWSDYRAAGGVEEALANRLSDYLTTIDADSTNALKRLVTAEADKPISRRRAFRSECTAEEWAHVEALARPKWRLLTTDTVAGEASAEVAHEDVLRLSSPIADWIVENRRFLEWKTRLESDRLSWELLGAQPDDLLPRTRIDAYRRELGKDLPGLGKKELEFLEASERRLKDEAARRAEEAQQLLRADQSERTLGGLRRLAWALVTIGAAAGIA